MKSDERRPFHLAALASAAVGGLDPVRVAEVYDGERGHLAALVVDSKDRRWLVEEPVSEADSAAEELSAPLLPLLDARLPYSVPQPAGSTVVRKIGRVTVTPWLEDQRIAFDDVPPGPGLAAEIGRALAAVHNLDPALYDEAGVPTYDAEAYRRRRLSELDRAAATGHVPTGLLTRWEEALELVPLWRFAATPIHGAFDGDAVRVRFTGDDASDGTITTITSWQHARVADPADDFAALYDEAHPDTFDSVLEAYAQARTERPDRGLETRARLAAELEPVSALLRAHAAGDTVVVEEIAGQLRILDAETADHPLVRRPAPAVAPAAAVAPAEDESAAGQGTEDDHDADTGEAGGHAVAPGADVTDRSDAPAPAADLTGRDGGDAPMAAPTVDGSAADGAGDDEVELVATLEPSIPEPSPSVTVVPATPVPAGEVVHVAGVHDDDPHAEPHLHAEPHASSDEPVVADVEPHEHVGTRGADLEPAATTEIPVSHSSRPVEDASSTATPALQRVEDVTAQQPVVVPGSGAPAQAVSAGADPDEEPELLVDDETDEPELLVDTSDRTSAGAGAGRGSASPGAGSSSGVPAAPAHAPVPSGTASTDGWDGDSTTELPPPAATGGLVGEAPAHAAGSRPASEARNIRFTTDDTVEIPPRLQR